MVLIRRVQFGRVTKELMKIKLEAYEIKHAMVSFQRSPQQMEQGHWPATPFLIDSNKENQG